MQATVISWRAWYADGTIRSSELNTWQDGAKRVLINLENDGNLLLVGDFVKEILKLAGLKTVYT